MFASIPGAARAHPTFNVRRFGARAFGPSILLSLAACLAPQAQPLDIAAASAAVRARGTDAELLRQELERIAWRSPNLPRPRLEPASQAPDLDAPDYWQACAVLWNGEVRAARLRLAASLAALESAGAPQGSELNAEVFSEAGDSAGQMSWTFDVLGWLGSGRSRAARALASSEVRAASVELEQALWAARFRVERARARASDAWTQIKYLRQHLGSAQPALARGQALFEQGRLSEGGRAVLRMAHWAEEHALHLREQALAAATAELADACGLEIENPALAAVSETTLDRQLQSARPVELPGLETLAERVPQVRRARLEHAVAEARLRAAAAETWPELRLGPALEFGPGDTLVGGMLSLPLPHARRLRGAVEAAVEQRAAARAAFEESLRAARARAAEAQRRLQLAREALEQHVQPRETESAVAWRSAQAAFETDPTMAKDAAAMFLERGMALSDLFDTRLELALASLDFQEACGPDPSTSAAQERP
jgi:outer membrane protein TolC